jgi:hypothetical protein
VSGMGKILLSWSAPQGASAFDIYRGSQAGAEESVPLATNISSLTQARDGNSAVNTWPAPDTVRRLGRMRVEIGVIIAYDSA